MRALALGAQPSAQQHADVRVRESSNASSEFAQAGVCAVYFKSCNLSCTLMPGGWCLLHILVLYPAILRSGRITISISTRRSKYLTRRRFIVTDFVTPALAFRALLYKPSNIVSFLHTIALRFTW